MPAVAFHVTVDDVLGLEEELRELQIHERL